MALSGRLLTSVSVEYRDRFAALASARGVSVSHLLARLERRAKLRQATPSGYVAHLLRAHLRAEPPMPYAEFQTLKRVVNELAGIRGALNELVTKPPAGAMIEEGLRENIFKLLPALKSIRTQVHDTLVANAKSWAAPDA
jgi:hypothetical protein